MNSAAATIVPPWLPQLNATPNDQVAGDKNHRRHIVFIALALAPLHRVIHQDHRCGAWQHHAQHHHPPHGEHPWCRERHCHVGHLRPLSHRRHRHVHVLTGDEQIQPRDRRHAGKRQQRAGTKKPLSPPGAQGRRAVFAQNARAVQGLRRPGKRREMPVVALAHHVEDKARSRAHGVARCVPEPDAGPPDVPRCRYRTARRCGCAMARPRSRTTAHRGSRPTASVLPSS